ncbi:peptide deformylase [Raoultibacter timonensis]|uniref:Peptide deformylase n=1 Tax=Raoultibacter timonensis TaxID=1907662 RepID=A0ABM7WJH6_9ACTN|nr:peptide deformylase [Raoultibacter timonensis]BDE96484.1 peptide deformylase [Raoultibacter timonensis]BDF51087.1 peptide deformylase [Raoultibacter timonensis]
MNIVLSPDPMLRQVCEPCRVEDKSIKKLAKQMAKAMYKNNGCGLAAPQVGVLKRVVVVDCDTESDEKNPIYMINPELVELQGDPIVMGEGCLSCPGITVEIARPPFAKVRFLDLDGEEWTIEGDGLLGRCLQHELDHLDGKTMFEVCDPMTRIEALRAYEVALANGAKPGETGPEQ